MKKIILSIKIAFYLLAFLGFVDIAVQFITSKEIKIVRSILEYLFN